jgi:hypothetical protein
MLQPVSPRRKPYTVFQDRAHGWDAIDWCIDRAVNGLPGPARGGRAQDV